MAAIRHLLERWGFVKLSRYGLELTPDGRVVSRRPVLDDGTGARIVGWQDGDVAIWKLSNRDSGARLALPAASPSLPASARSGAAAAPAGPATPATAAGVSAARPLPGVAPVGADAPSAARSPRAASAPAIVPDRASAAMTVVCDPEAAALAQDPAITPATPATTVAAPPSGVAAPAHETAPADIMTTTPLPLVASRTSFAAPAAAQQSSAAAAATPNAPAAAAAVSVSSAWSSATILPSEVASPAPVDEDDWEWTIALARARVAVEEAQSPRRRAPSPAEPTLPARVTARPTVVREPTSATGDWPATMPIGSIDYDDYRIATRPAIPLPSVLQAAGARPAPTTVIPVPPLPTVETTMHVRLEPVVRTAHAAPATGRLAKGTGPRDPEQAASRRRASMVIDEATANLAVGDRTRPGVAVAAAQARRTGTTLGTAAPASSDHTKPGIALPAVARAVALPSTKRRNVPR